GIKWISLLLGSPPSNPLIYPSRRVFPSELLITRRKAAEGAAMSNDKQQESLNLAGLASALSEEDRAGLVNALKVRSWALFGLC
ncbi:hypothetical protein GW17_00007093, partial [Ensete ventricosum]